MDLEEIKRGLRAEIKKRENEQYLTFQTNIRDMCKDVLAKLEEQESKIAELKAIDSKNRSAYYKDLAMLAKDVEHQKYKRCLLRSVIAEMNATHFKDLFYGAGSEALADEYNKQITIHYKWQKRWLALAEKFKPNKSTAQ